jgi:hypothetical protein
MAAIFVAAARRRMRRSDTQKDTHPTMSGIWNTDKSSSLQSLIKPHDIVRDLVVHKLSPSGGTRAQK